MAKAAPVELRPEMTFAEAAQRTVAVRTRELWEHSEGVLDTGDIERVHDMRVATRRLRAVLEIFAPCFPRKEHKAALREVKRLADALGARRDPDVQLEALAGRDGIGAFVDRVLDEQRAGNEALADALRHAEGLRERLDRLVAA
jgi:CHAD domain-containing protein